MPQVRKLSAAEVATIEYKPRGLRKLVEEQYNAFLKDYAVGEYGEADLEPGENRLTVRNRLRAASRRRGLEVLFKRTTGTLIRFQVVDGAPKPAAAVVSPAPTPVEAVSSDVAPAPKRRGRPKQAPASTLAMAADLAPKRRGRPKKAV